jgi:hypothetical protein
VGTDSSAFASAALNNGDVVTCIFTSSSACANPDTALSNSIGITVNPTVTPSITITGKDTICEGSSVTFSANAANAGSSPVYQWYINGSNAGNNSNSFTSSTISNQNVITCKLTSNAGCASPDSANSNSIDMTVVPLPSAPVIHQSGDSLISNAQTGNQWYLNDTELSGATSEVYVPLETGNYSVKVANGNNCSSDNGVS